MEKEIHNRFIAMLEDSDRVKVRRVYGRQPVHVVYGGAHLFQSDTPGKLGSLALRSLETYAPDFAEFARAVWLKGAENLPKDPDSIRDLEFQIADAPEKARRQNADGWFAWTIYNKTIHKLETEPVEDFRIDFEDGYGFRDDAEEDAHSIAASEQLAIHSTDANAIQAIGFRIKSLQPETRVRAIRTLDLFLLNLLQKTHGKLPVGFVVALPKVKSPAETAVLDGLLHEIEKRNGLSEGAVKIEILIETPECIPVMKEIVEAANGRCIAAHFGAFDFTSSMGIAASHQHIRHQACNFARNMMLVSLAPLGLRLSDSVTTKLPVPLHKGENLSISQIAENRFAVREAWRRHFKNVTISQINGFYQSWDLHPAQLPARYAAVYAFFLESFEEQAKRLRGFLEKATQAITTGNIFDDLASAEGLLNYFVMGVNCGAFTSSEVAGSVGISEEEFQTGSFGEIMKTRIGGSDAASHHH